MTIKLGPTGNLVQGDVLDVNKKALERSLQEYDRQLYLKWNPRKRSGNGCWELRRRPEKMTALPECIFEGNVYCNMTYIERDIVNHVLDLPALNYQVLEWIKRVDTWKSADWIGDLEYAEAKQREEFEAKRRKEMIYNAMQFKSQIKGFKELVASGTNPALLAKHWGQSLGPL